MGANTLQCAWRWRELEAGGAETAVLDDPYLVPAFLQALDKCFPIVTDNGGISIAEQYPAACGDVAAVRAGYHHNGTVLLFYREASGDPDQFRRFDGQYGFFHLGVNGQVINVDGQLVFRVGNQVRQQQLTVAVGVPDNPVSPPYGNIGEAASIDDGKTVVHGIGGKHILVVGDQGTAQVGEGICLVVIAENPACTSA